MAGRWSWHTEEMLRTLQLFWACGLVACAAERPARIRLVAQAETAQTSAHALQALVTCADASVPTGVRVDLANEAAEVLMEVPACGKASLQIWLWRGIGAGDTAYEVVSYYGQQNVELVSQRQTDVVVSAFKRGELAVFAPDNDQEPCALSLQDSSELVVATATLTTVDPARFSLPPGAYRASCVGRTDIVPTEVGVVFAQRNEHRLTKQSTPDPVPVPVVAPSNLRYPASSFLFTLGQPVPDLVPNADGDPVDNFALALGTESGQTLQASTGLSFDTKTGKISGTPSVLSNESSYIVTATNAGGSTTTSVTIRVVDAPPSNLAYSAPSITYVAGQAISANTPSAGGGAVVSYQISLGVPSGLSLSALTGLQFDPLTGVISGVPTPCASNVFTVSASNSGGTTTATVEIAVSVAPPLTLSYSHPTAVYALNGDITTNTPSVTGGAPTSYAIGLGSPSGLSLEAATGLTFNLTTGEISGAATTPSSANQYVITAINSGGTAQTTVTISVAVPARDCVDAKALNSGAPNGVYLIDPDGSGGQSAMSVYCDMVADGGGWAKVLQFASDPVAPSSGEVGAITNHPVSAFAKLSDDQINAFGSIKEYRFVATDATARMFIRSSAVFDSTAPGYGILASGDLYNNTGMPAAWQSFTNAGPHVLDSLHMSPPLTVDNCDRIYTDPNGTIECFGAPGQRCFRTGGSPCTGQMLNDLAIWVRAGSALGEVDTTFASGGITINNGQESATVAGVDAGGLVYVATESDQANRVRVCRYDPSGSLDLTYGVSGCAVMSGQRYLRSLKIDPNGRPVFGGVVNGQIMSLTRLNSVGGTAPPGFDITDDNPCAGVNQPDVFNGMAFTSDGKIVLGGSSQGSLGSNESAIWRYLDTGVKDTSFNGTGFICVNFNGPGFLNGGAQDSVQAVSVDKQNRIWALSDPDNGISTLNLLSRYTDTGLDTAFNGGNGFNTYLGQTASGAWPAALLTDALDRAYAYTAEAATGVDLVVRRYLDNGFVDASFGSSGVARLATGASLWKGFSESMVFDHSGNILITGRNSTNALVARFTSGGVLDASFGVGGVVVLTGMSEGHALAIDASGRIYVSGLKANVDNDSVVIRLR